MKLRKITIVTLCLLCGVTLSSDGRGATASTDAGAARIPVLAWQPCADPAQNGFDCASVEVPLDYGKPRGETISLAVIKRPTTDPANRVGTLFFNPGGPGGAGTKDLPAWIDFFAPELRARFDIVSWDPRGIGASTAVQCFDTEEDEERFFDGVPYDFFPVGDAEQREWIRRFARFGRVCARRNGKLLEHVSTADTARDLDLLRQFVGDAQLNYLGVSYGTFLGATYANLFPENVRVMVLDGNLDPVAYTNGGYRRAVLSTSLRLNSDVASAGTLDAFLDLCGAASVERCAFSAGDAAATRARWQTLLERVRAQPVTLDGTTYTYAALVSYVGRSLFTVEARPNFPGWTAAAQTLKTLWTLSDPAARASAPGPIASQVLEEAESESSAANIEQRYAGAEQTFAVQCAESPNPRDPWMYPQLEAFTFARAGAVGTSLLWGDQPCADWQADAADPYYGPWNRRTANPILVIGNTFDPSTPYQGAIAMSRLLARARLLTVDGYGHTVLLNPSACAAEYQSRYFIDGTLPPRGTVCRQDAQPFTTHRAAP